MLLTNEEAAAMIRIAPLTLKTWRRQGKGPQPWYLNGAVRYKRADVEAWLEEHLTTTPAPR